ncbi:MAG: hypothetical protein K2H64_00040 [Desulfovibrio sp.]|nr:hypothetical protein [Desulfovibrio sp.]
MPSWLLAFNREEALMEENIRELAALLPDEVIFEAAAIHIRELAKTGDLEKAEALFGKLRLFPEAGLSRAKAGRFLAARFLFSGERGMALEIYNEAFADEKNPEIFLEKLLALDLLARDSATGRLREVVDLWRPLGENLLADGFKSHWAETGVALMEGCRKTDNKQLAEAIFYELRERASSGKTKAIIERAERILKKMGS